VQLYGAPIELKSYVEAAAKRTATVALTALKQSLRGERRPVDVVLLAGGGAKVYEDATREAFPRARLEMSDNPVLANVRGFWAHANLVAPERESPPAPAEASAQQTEAAYDSAP